MNEIISKIRLFGNPVLRKKAVAIKHITSVHGDILTKMARLMSDASGVGLAAPQVGFSEAMIVVDIGSGLYKLINPEVVKKEGIQIMEEGCLSIPGVCLKIKRAKKVVVKAQDEFAKSLTIDAEGLLACVFQHEIDHLKGRLIIDYVSFFKRVKIRKKLEELKKRSKDEEILRAETKSCKLQL